MKTHPIYIFLSLLIVASSSIAADVFVTSVHVTHVTSTTKDADTDDDFTLRIVSPGHKQVSLTFPDLPPNERELGRQDDYTFDVSASKLTSKGIKNARIFMRIHGTFAWLPASFQVTARLSDGTTVTLVDRSWPEKWFSTEAEFEEDRVGRWYWSVGPDGRRHLAFSYFTTYIPLVEAAEWELTKPKK